MCYIPGSCFVRNEALALACSCCAYPPDGRGEFEAQTVGNPESSRSSTKTQPGTTRQNSPPMNLINPITCTSSVHLTNMSRLFSRNILSRTATSSIHTSPRPYSTTMQPKFSPGTDETLATSALTPLLTSSGGRWTLSTEGQAVERSFKFKTFAKTWVRVSL